MMFGHDAWGERAFAAPEFFELDMQAFRAFLAGAAEARNWLLEIDGFSLAQSSGLSGAFGDMLFGALPFAASSGAVTGGAVTLRWSSHGYTSRPTDAPASAWYEGRLTDQIRVERSIAGRAGIGGLSRVFAEAALVNVDGGLDQIAGSMALDGRPVRLLIGRPDDARADYGLVFSGVVESITVGTDSVRLALSDGAAKLDVPIQTALYAGTGGLEGGADLASKPKPLAWGHAWNVSPPLVDPVLLIYQVNDGVTQDVPAGYDRGVELTRGADYTSAADMTANAPLAGEYRAWLGGGYARLGATPAGTVTFDVQGSAASPGFVDRVSEILLRILAERAQLTASEIDPASFGRLLSDAPAPVGIWIGTEPRTVAEVVDELLAAAGAFGGFARTGAFSVGLIQTARGRIDGEILEDEILEIAREPLPESVEPAVWRVVVAWQRNGTVQSDLASSVPAPRRTFAAEAQRTAVREDVTLRSRRLLARDLGVVPALYAQQADAAAEAQRLLDLWGPGRALYRVRTRPQALPLDLGSVVTLTHRRFGLATGKAGRVLGHAVDGASHSVEIKVLV